MYIQFLKHQGKRCKQIIRHDLCFRSFHLSLSKASVFSFPTRHASAGEECTWQFVRHYVAFGMALFPQLGTTEYISNRRRFFCNSDKYKYKQQSTFSQYRIQLDNTRRFRHIIALYISFHHIFKHTKTKRPLEEFKSVFILLQEKNHVKLARQIFTGVDFLNIISKLAMGKVVIYQTNLGKEMYNRSIIYKTVTYTEQEYILINQMACRWSQLENSRVNSWMLSHSLQNFREGKEIATL